MKLSAIKAKPQLIMISLDDEDIVKEYGEPLEFYTWDRQPMTTFVRMAATEGVDTAKIFELVRTLVLDENGKQIFNDKDEETIPGKVLMRVISKVVELLGK